jgi:hypothetical protein
MHFMSSHLTGAELGFGFGRATDITDNEMSLFAGRTPQTDEPFEHHFFYWSAHNLDLMPGGGTPKNRAGHRTPTRLRRRRRYPTHERQPQSPTATMTGVHKLKQSIFVILVTRKPQAGTHAVRKLRLYTRQTDNRINAAHNT